MAWIRCPCCENYLCTAHGMHVHDCPCPPIEEWASSPYEESMPKHLDTFAARLHALREKAGLSVAALALLAGMSREQVWRLEKGRCQPSLDAAKKLAVALGQPLTVWE